MDNIGEVGHESRGMYTGHDSTGQVRFDSSSVKNMDTADRKSPITVRFGMRPIVPCGSIDQIADSMPDRRTLLCQCRTGRAQELLFRMITAARAAKSTTTGPGESKVRAQNLHRTLDTRSPTPKSHRVRRGATAGLSTPSSSPRWSKGARILSLLTSEKGAIVSNP